MPAKVYSIIFSLLLLFPLHTTAQDIFYKSFTGNNNYTGPSVSSPPEPVTALGNDGYFLLAESDHPFPNLETYITAFDACDELKWQRSMGMRYFSAAGQKKDLLLLGWKDDMEMILARLDSNGNLRFARSFEESLSKAPLLPQAIDVFADESYFLAAQIPSKDKKADLALMLFNKDGQSIWNKTYKINTMALRFLCRAKALSDGGILLAGRSLQESHGVVWKVDRTGELVWIRQYQGALWPFATPLETEDGYLFTFREGHTRGIAYFYMLKTDFAGNTLWVSERFLSADVHSAAYLRSKKEIVAAGWYEESVVPGDNLNTVTVMDNSGLVKGQSRLVETADENIFKTMVTSLYGSHFLLSGITANTNNVHSLTLRKAAGLADLNNCGFEDYRDTKPPLPVEMNQTITHHASFQLHSDAINPGVKNILLNETVKCFEERPFPPLSLGNDTLLCPGDTMLLRPDRNYGHYLWSTGETSAAITVTNSGTYWLTAGYSCQEGSDTIRVEFAPAPHIEIEASPLKVSALEAVHFKGLSTGIAWEEWRLKDQLLSENRNFSHTFNRNGTHTIIYLAGDKYGCIYIDSVEIEVSHYSCFIPNTFTPNRDGKNDLFLPKGFGISSYDITIYNRWGEIVFQGKDQPWQPVEAQDGLYIYDIILTNDFGEIIKKTGKVYVLK